MHKKRGKNLILRCLSLALTFIESGVAQAESTFLYHGTAQSKNGQVSYLEKHTVEIAKGGTVVKARTDYTRASGDVFGKLQSDFSKSITAPNYTFEDLRDGSSHGMEFDGNKYTLWKTSKGGKREQKEFSTEDFDKGTLIVGCQGLHYYLVKNLESLRGRKDIKVKYLIPGKLDYYSFLLNFEKEDEEFIHLSVKVQNLFLRAFVSSLKMTYRKADRRLVAYSGLSNIATDAGDMQNVQITYAFDPPAKGATP